MSQVRDRHYSFFSPLGQALLSLIRKPRPSVALRGRHHVNNRLAHLYSAYRPLSRADQVRRTESVFQHLLDSSFHGFAFPGESQGVP